MAAIEVDVVIIGAGISGLSAAYKLCEKDENLDLYVLEAKGFMLHFRAEPTLIAFWTMNF